MINRVNRVLNGHTDADSAYLVEDYPYGNKRCRIRYWVETGTKGQGKGRQRFVSQTTNPRKEYQPWNKPHPSTYASVAVMYLDKVDHVQWWSVGAYLYPYEDARMRLMGLYDGLDDETRTRYDFYVRVMTEGHASRGLMADWETRLTMVMDHIRRTGDDPVTPEDNPNFWEDPATNRAHYFSGGLDVYIAVARERLAAE